MTITVPSLVAAMRGWDRPRPQATCWHCDGTGLAPSLDGRTACGFCVSPGAVVIDTTCREVPR